jgi:hypothetical protein
MGKVLLHPSMLYLQNLQIYTATYSDQPNKINTTHRGKAVRDTNQQQD